MRTLLIAISLFAAGAYAQEADSAAGGALYEAQCLVCHGQNGTSAIPANPILAGQHEDYLREQIAAYRDGTRQNAVMAGMAKGLTDQQIAYIARYLAEQQPVIAGAANMDAAAQAENLYRFGDAERGLSACAACHGPEGAGVAALAPALSGQHAAYTAAALRAYINGERPAAAMMNDIAPKLTDDEISLLSEYISGLSY